MELDVAQPISPDTELLKALTKQIYFKRIDEVMQLINKHKDGLNFIGLVNTDKKNTRKI